MQTRQIGRAPDYTNAALAMALINLLWIFFAIWALFGLGPVLLAALTLNHAIDWIARRRRHRPSG